MSEYDIALKEMQLEPQNVWNKYIRLAEQSQEQGMNQNHDTLDLAVMLWWNDNKSKSLFV